MKRKWRKQSKSLLRHVDLSNQKMKRKRPRQSKSLLRHLDLSSWRRRIKFTFLVTMLQTSITSWDHSSISYCNCNLCSNNSCYVTITDKRDGNSRHLPKWLYSENLYSIQEVNHIQVCSSIARLVYGCFRVVTFIVSVQQKANHHKFLNWKI